MKLQVEIRDDLIQAVHHMAELNGVTIKFLIHTALESWLENPTLGRIRVPLKEGKRERWLGDPENCAVSEPILADSDTMADDDFLQV